MADDLKLLRKNIRKLLKKETIAGTDYFSSTYDENFNRGVFSALAEIEKIRKGVK